MEFDGNYIYRALGFAHFQSVLYRDKFPSPLLLELIEAIAFNKKMAGPDAIEFKDGNPYSYDLLQCKKKGIILTHYLYEKVAIFLILSL